MLRKFKPRKRKLSRDRCTFPLNMLKENHTQTILPENKRNETVVMGIKQDKDNKNKILEDGPYRNVRNATRRIALEDA